MRSIAPLLVLVGCSTLSGARPLEPGQHAVGATVGGVLVPLGPIPLPNVNVEAKHGLVTIADRPLDLNYGLNVTGLPFGIVQGHIGNSFLLFDQAKARPALSLTQRLFLATNSAGASNRVTSRVQGWALDQIELTASWKPGHQLVYVGVAEYIDWGQPSLLITPSVGAQLDPGEPGGFLIQPELRWYGVGRTTDADNIDWVGPTGALGFSLGFATRFGG